MSINRRNLLTTGLAVALAAAMVIGGGTFAYLQSSTDDVVNQLSNQSGYGKSYRDHRQPI